METTTINLRDLPKDLVQHAKLCAVLRGISLKEFMIVAMTKAIEEEIPAAPTKGILGALVRKAISTKKQKPRPQR